MATSLLVLVLAALLPSATAGKVFLKSGLHSGHIVKSISDFAHTLRVCNAYPSEVPMTILRGMESLRKTPLAYKECDEFSVSMVAGEKLDFKLEDPETETHRAGPTTLASGTFSISEVPEFNTVLLLVVFRRDVASATMAFESHVFGNLANSQLAVLDTYQGTAKAIPMIRENSTSKVSASERMEYNTVVAVQPGTYKIELASGTKVEDTKVLVAKKGGSYVVLRVGAEPQQGEKFPQELLVYPEPSTLKSGAQGAHGSFFLATVLMLAGAAMW